MIFKKAQQKRKTYIRVIEYGETQAGSTLPKIYIFKLGRPDAKLYFKQFIAHIQQIEVVIIYT